MTALTKPWHLAAVAASLMRPAVAASLLALAAGVAAQAPAPPASRSGDYIAAVVNQELVTAGEIERRVARVQAEAARGGATLPPAAELRRQVTDALIDERVIISTAREFGLRIDEPEIDRAVQSVAAQNQLTLEQLRERLRSEGIEYGRFRSNLRDQLLLERMRENEVYRRIRVSDEEIDQLLAAQRQAAQANAELNIAQILVTVPEGAGPDVLAARRARIDAAAARLRVGEDFAAVARELSEDGNRAQGGEIGMRPPSRLPDLFVEAVRGLKTGEVTSEPLRTGAGFHLLKVVARRDGGSLTENQTRARHVLLRTSPQLSAEVAARRLAEYKRQIEGGRSFEEVARLFSEDGSAPAGGDLGWSGPGTMVPEFEQAMNALPIGGLSAPVVSRFGVHLIQVVERRSVPVDPKQLREQARNVLREQKFEPAYLDWTKELRSRAYVEMREPPQ
jgi:peptidyl-prolyl cis-trans isomerase SurA